MPIHPSITPAVANPSPPRPGRLAMSFFALRPKMTASTDGMNGKSRKPAIPRMSEAIALPLVP